jgi:hypothetical protein
MAIIAFQTRFDSERYTAAAADEKREPPDAKPLASTRLNGCFPAAHGRPGMDRS